ncbi:MAG: DUF882 domain-containing protein [Candidatus Thiodiazotropha sp. 6PLUC4]
MAISQVSTVSRLSRRAFLGGCLSVGGMLVASPLMAGLIQENQRTLSFRHTHTGEKEKITYWRDGHYLNQELQQLNHLLRDHRTGEIAAMDTGLLDLLYGLQLKVGKRGDYEIISAYRSPKTNQMLRSKSNGVAKKSFHMQGKAIDVRLCNCDLKYLRESALALKAGGVGYYPKSGFLHLDTGRVRRW